MNKKNSILILDRDITRINYFDLNFKNKVLNYKVVKNINDFYEALMGKKWDYIFIENDLSPSYSLASSDPASGYNAIPVIFEQYPYRNELTVFVHTNNQGAIQSIQDYIYVNNIAHLVVFAPFGTATFRGEMIKLQKILSNNAQY